MKDGRDRRRASDGQGKSSGFALYGAILSSACVLRIVGCVGVVPVLI